MFEKYLNKLEIRVSHISFRNFNPRLFSFEWFLVGISHLYGLGLRFWFCLYKTGILKQKTLPCFVVSVGNIVAGGTGKTPMTVYVAKVLKEMAKQPVIISRGYKGKYKGDSAIVSDGSRIFSDAEESGDEAYMMANEKKIPVVIGRERWKAGMKAVNAFKTDVIVLDDGFQHLKLKRDLDLLLLDYSNPLGNNRLFPAGRLRETAQSSAQRADAVIFTRSRKNDCKDDIKKKLHHYPGRPWFKTFHVPCVYEHIGDSLDSKIKNINGLKGKKTVLFSGLANNRYFYDAMKELDINILCHLEFKDHHRYNNSDTVTINKAAKKKCADIILTTQKDWSKLDSNIKWSRDLLVVGINIQFQEPEKFKTFLSIKLHSK